MEEPKRRSSSRARKPTAKLAESPIGLGSSILLNKKNVMEDAESEVDTFVESQAKKGKDKETTSIRGDERLKSNTQCAKRLKETAKVNKIDSNTISRSTECDSLLVKAEANADIKKEQDNIMDFATEQNADFKQGANSGIVFDDEKESNKAKSTDEVIKPTKKRTVQVCVRLKDMMLVPDFTKGGSGTTDGNLTDKKVKCGKVLEEKESGKQSLNSEKSDDLSEFGKERTVVKEDGTFIEDFETKKKIKREFVPEKTIENERFIGDTYTSNTTNLTVKCEFDEGSKKVVDGVTRMFNDVDVQAEMDYEDLDDSDEDMSDLDEEGTEKILKCHVCSKVFSNKSNLNKHLALHTVEKPNQCEICGMSFAIRAYLTVHRVVHNGDRKHKCEVCGKSFLRRNNLNSHMQTHTDLKPFSCEICGKKFKTKSGRETHRKEHGPELGYQCDKCGKSYGQQAYLQKHISVHAGIKPFQCLVCGKSFPYNQSLQEHMRRHKGEKPEVCDKCGKSFNNKRQLRSHMKYHNTVTEFACKDCNMFYDSQQSLNKHLSKTHKITHKCDFCNKSFVNKKHLRTHQANDHKDHLAAIRKIPPANLAKVKKVFCPLCNRVFFNRYVLSKHMMSKHQLIEQEIKELLKIRKKAIGKTNSEKLNNSDVNDVYDKALEHDSFRVYYKDDEMAVYVKGTDTFDSRLKAMVDGNNTSVNENIGAEEVRYIVLEENDVGEGIVPYLGDTAEVMNLNESMVQEIHTVAEDDNVSPSNMDGKPEEATATDQNYYVVFTEANEKSENVVEEIDSKIVTEAEIQNLADNGAEQIVLILNEGGDSKNFMLESGEHYEIVADGADFVHEDGKEHLEEYEIVASEPMTMSGDAKCLSSDMNRGGLIGTKDKAEKVVVDSGEEIHGHNLPLLEQLQRQESMNDNKNNSEKMEHAHAKEDSHTIGLPHVVNPDLTNSKVGNENDQAQSEANADINLAEENYIVIPTGDDLKAQCSTSSYTNRATNSRGLEMGGFDELLPKNDSAQEFNNFENALKLKSTDFQNQEEYNTFIDKMIQTLQKAKQTDPK